MENRSRLGSFITGDRENPFIGREQNHLRIGDGFAAFIHNTHLHFDFSTGKHLGLGRFHFHVEPFVRFPHAQHRHAVAGAWHLVLERAVLATADQHQRDEHIRRVGLIQWNFDFWRVAFQRHPHPSQDALAAFDGHQRLAGDRCLHQQPRRFARTVFLFVRHQIDMRRIAVIPCHFIAAADVDRASRSPPRVPRNRGL